ncbi:MAG: hypothetical protein JWR10_3692 [Rubritepida sp.]|nr:hypothetical protein [Rubritepida sp.]
MEHWVWLTLLAAAMGATGLLSGLLAGLFGVGGGIVIVPVLFYVLPLFDVPSSTQMKVAVATSLATIIPTSIVSARKHLAKGAIDIPLLKSLTPSMFVGVIIGTVLTAVLKGPGLTFVFACVALLVAINMGLTSVTFRLRDSMPFGWVRQVVGTGIGVISAVMGIGGGTVGVPVLGMFGTPIRSAVATASTFGIVISIPATIGLILAGIGAEGRPPYSLGWVSLVGFALIVPGSILATPWGVSLAHSLRPVLLKRAFAIFLAFTALRMFSTLI